MRNSCCVNERTRQTAHHSVCVECVWVVEVEHSPPGLQTLLFVQLAVERVFRDSHDALLTTIHAWKNEINKQSCPIEMRGQILYLANRWTEFEMLLTSNRFLDLIRFLLQSFPPIPQFIAQFRPICLILCIVLPYSFSYRNESSSRAARK